MLWRNFAAEMAAELGDAVKQWKIEEIIPVPLHRSRQRIRGYNQAQILAEELGKRLDLPVNKDAVKRIQKNATSESAWEQRQDSKSKRSIWCHKILDSEKNVCWSSMIFIQPEIPYTEWQRCWKCRSTKSIFFDHKHWTRTLTVWYTKNDV